MSKYVSPADKYLVTVNPRKHVRHLTVLAWVEYEPDYNVQRNFEQYFPLCGTGDIDSQYVTNAGVYTELPICKRCKHRLNEYIENIQREAEAL